MPDPIQLALFFAAALVLAVTPGPGIFYVAARSLAGGRAEGVASSFGTGLGGMVHVVAGSLGVSALVLTSASVHGAQAGRSGLPGLARLPHVPIGPQGSAWASGGAAAPAIGTWRAFREGVLVEALNPKTAAFFLAFIPQFVDPAAGRVAVQFVVLGTISVVLNTAADIVVAVAANGIQEGAAARPALVRRLREGSGAAMIALGLGLTLAKRPGG